MPKSVTYERAETMWQRAIEGSRRLGLDDVASDYESMGLDGYIEHKGLKITNPTNPQSSERSENTMATLREENEELLDLLDTIWNFHVDIDKDSSEADMLEASDKTCDALNEYDSERFPMDGDEGEDE